MITYKEIDKTFFAAYDSIEMLVNVNSTYILEKQNGGLGGVLLRETPTQSYVKSLGKYAVATNYAKEFNIENWGFIMAFDGAEPVAALTLAAKTPGVNMLNGREDLCVLWDIRVKEAYKRKGIGQGLFNTALQWAKKRGYVQLKIECQNNNVPACKFYHKQGAALAGFDEYAYYADKEISGEVQLTWYLNL